MLNICPGLCFSISWGEPINIITMDTPTTSQQGLFPFIEGIVARKNELGHTSTAGHYKRTAKRFLQFCCNPQKGLTDLNITQIHLSTITTNEFDRANALILTDF